MAGQDLVRPISLYAALFPNKKNSVVIKLHELIDPQNQCQMQSDLPELMHDSQTQLSPNAVQESVGVPGSTVAPVPPAEMANISWLSLIHI